MASSLSNNLIDFDHPLYAVKGFEGDNLDELQQNLKTKKIVGVGSDGGIEVHWNNLFIQRTRLFYQSLSLLLWGMWFGC